MAKKKTTNEVEGEVLMGMPVENLEPIADDFKVAKNMNMVYEVNTILSNVQTLIHYLEYAHAKGMFSFADCADIYHSITEINSVTDRLEGK